MPVGDHHDSEEQKHREIRGLELGPEEKAERGSQRNDSERRDVVLFGGFPLSGVISS
jgi:hypothetical protein